MVKNGKSEKAHVAKEYEEGEQEDFRFVYETMLMTSIMSKEAEKHVERKKVDLPPIEKWLERREEIRKIEQPKERSCLIGEQRFHSKYEVSKLIPGKFSRKDQLRPFASRSNWSR